MKLVCILIALCLLLSGCGKTNVPAALPTAEITESDFSFELPEGFAFADETATAISITKDGKTIGGIVNTCLDTAVLEEEYHTSISRYYDTVYPSPLIPEWFAFNGDNVLIMTLSITNSETNERTETIRRIFAHDELVYDCWLDCSLVSEDESQLIFGTILQNY